MRCPECSSEGPFEIEVLATATISDDGIEEVADVTWSDASDMACPCGWGGAVSEASSGD